MNFKPGDTVTILNESGFCTFLSEKNKRALIQDENGFEREVDFKYIVMDNLNVHRTKEL